MRRWTSRVQVRWTSREGWSEVERTEVAWEERPTLRGRVAGLPWRALGVGVLLLAGVLGFVYVTFQSYAGGYHPAPALSWASLALGAGSGVAMVITAARARPRPERLARAHPVARWLFWYPSGVLVWSWLTWAVVCGACSLASRHLGARETVLLPVARKLEEHGSRGCRHAVFFDEGPRNPAGPFSLCFTHEGYRQLAVGQLHPVALRRSWLGVTVE